jgi:hypothetical protein
MSKGWVLILLPYENLASSVVAIHTCTFMCGDETIGQTGVTEVWGPKVQLCNMPSRCVISISSDQPVEDALI